MDKPPITGKEIAPLSSGALVGFKLAPGPVPESYRFFDPLQGDSNIINGNSNPGVSEGSSRDVDEGGKNRKRPKRSLDDYEGKHKLSFINS